VRKLEIIYYPLDNCTYAYGDIINYSDPYYPNSYSSEVGVFSSKTGHNDWIYHGIVIRRGEKGQWDSGGVASPGAVVTADGSVLVGYAAENSPTGGKNRGIALARAPHPLGARKHKNTPIMNSTLLFVHKPIITDVMRV